MPGDDTCAKSCGVSGSNGINGPEIFIPFPVHAIECPVEHRVGDMHFVRADPNNRFYPRLVSDPVPSRKGTRKISRIFRVILPYDLSDPTIF